MDSVGDVTSNYGFANEWTSQGLIYLRARYYDPAMGRFLNRDPSGWEDNLFLYASANPVTRRDPTGLFSEYLTGPLSFALCFNFHSIPTHGWEHDADVDFAISVCRNAYSTNNWNSSWFDFTKTPESAHDLFGWYLFEKGKDSMHFDGDSPITKELADSTLISDLRSKYYLQGDMIGDNISKFEYLAFMRSILQDYKDSIFKFSLPISFFLGSFYYQIVTLPGEDRVGFRIDNRTDLESGTHHPGRYPGEEFSGSVEELLAIGEVTGSTLLTEAFNKEVDGKRALSILRFRTRAETTMERPLGGGGLIQTYTWTEKRNECFWWMEFLPYIPTKAVMGPILPWPDYETYTQDVTWP